MLIPQPRGDLSRAVGAWLRAPEAADSKLAADLIDSSAEPAETLTDVDLQLSLWMLYELHYRSFEDAADDAEWSPELLAVRRRLEAVFDAGVEQACADLIGPLATAAPQDVPDRLFEFVDTYPGPSLAEYVQRHADRDQVRELLMHRSIYHLKEADPHSFVLPRLNGAAKAGLVELQYDEYGDGDGDRIHQRLFAKALQAADLDPSYGAHVGVVPAEVLAISNVMSLFGLHRRRRGAAMGHLAAFEATSSVPCRRYAAGIRRVGLGDPVAQYFDEHVEADAVHEQLAVRVICAALLAEDRTLQRDIAIGAAACLRFDAGAAVPLLETWKRGGHLVDPPASDRALAVTP
ncbi:iron-containing redox enzyme family protein [Microlunatus elymi]|uniref:Iron-containing redox enzyme family protein n=1 Tax=Microlunatus elymi TaxID=2596828 RepID=A0A516PYE9_9ACTN|nr:iron-containing redox enzyme family protein [Microlunatus elymi]QDP96001.1 iron-containing redox enzyme family protein [Microlunatus elymi]